MSAVLDCLAAGMTEAEIAEPYPSLPDGATRAAVPLAAEVARLEEEEHLRRRIDGLWRQQETCQSWISRHPEAERRLNHLATRSIPSTTPWTGSPWVETCRRVFGLTVGSGDADKTGTLDSTWAGR